ncbi:substrate-binding periplasmic protein [Massilia sp. SM-13]|uniref:substrate-binding periplasmic protein n=1 Tax=Pseudoduganella rhizocola TaxID=3382643 RepID=UPI0038B50414
MQNALRRLIACASLALAASATAATVDRNGVLTLSLCIEENPFPPFIYTDRDGAIPILIKMAAREAGMKVAFHRAPYLRCLAEISSGQADGYPSAAIANVTKDLVFPRSPKAPDAAHATVTTRVMVYRPSGSTVNWDGKQFSGLTGPVLHDRTTVLVAQRLQALGVAADNNAKNSEASFSKLLLGRGALAISFEASAAPLMAQPRYASKIEMLPVPFYVENYYLAVSRSVYAGHGAKVDALWEAIARVKHSPEYAAATRDLPHY